MPWSPPCCARKNWRREMAKRAVRMRLPWLASTCREPWKKLKAQREWLLPPAPRAICCARSWQSYAGCASTNPLTRWRCGKESLRKSSKPGSTWSHNSRGRTGPRGMVQYGNPSFPIRFRFHRDRIRLRRQRIGASVDGEGIPGCCPGDGAPLGAPFISAHKLVDSSVVLASESRSARLLQHAFLPTCHHFQRLCGWWRVDYLCRHSAASSGQGLAQRIMGRLGGLSDRDASTL